MQSDNYVWRCCLGNRGCSYSVHGIIDQAAGHVRSPEELLLPHRDCGNWAKAKSCSRTTQGHARPTKSGAGDGNRTHRDVASGTLKQAIWPDGGCQV